MQIENRNRMAWCYGKVPALVYLEREGSPLAEFRLGQDPLGGTVLLTGETGSSSKVCWLGYHALNFWESPSERFRFPLPGSP